MKLKQYLSEDSCDYYEWNDFHDLNDDPRNMPMNELQKKTADLYGVDASAMIWDRSTLTELFNLKTNYRSLTFDEAVLALRCGK